MTAHVFEFLPSQHIVYRGAGRGPGHINELHWDNNSWHTSDITEDAHAPVAGDVQITDYTFEDQGTQHVNYLGQDGHLNELVWNYDNGWLVNDLTLAARPPLKKAGHR